MRFVLEWLVFIPLLIIADIFIFDIHKILEVKTTFILISILVFIFGLGSSIFVVFAGRKKNNDNSAIKDEEEKK